MDGHWSHEMKRCLLLGKKVMTNLDSMANLCWCLTENNTILQNNYPSIKRERKREIWLYWQGMYSQSHGFPIVMHRCESWTIKKAKNQRIDAFEMWCWRRLFRVPWTARRSNQSIQNKINPEWSFEGVMLKLNEAPILSPPDAKSLLITKTLLLGSIEDRRRRGP